MDQIWALLLLIPIPKIRIKMSGWESAGARESSKSALSMLESQDKTE